MSRACASCGHDNPPPASVCVACASALGSDCKQCGEPLSANARFCPQCGAPARPSAPPAAPVIEGERRQLIVLFCDLVGSTELAERLDPEDWRDTVVRFQQEVTALIERAGGYVAQHLGDGLLVYFGYPRAREDDVERAVRCGLGLVSATRALNPELSALYGVTLSLRVGLHRGPLVVGEVGGARRETLALGSTANIAARVQGAAAPDTVFVTESIHELVQRQFVMADRGEHRLKGIERAVRLYAVTESSAASARLGFTGAGLTPFVNRVEELALLGAHFERAEAGHGSAIVIRADPGMGKSRLALSFRERIAAGPQRWVACRAAPYDRDSPLKPWLELQREQLGLAGAPAEQRAQLERSLAAQGFELGEAVPVFASLHGIPLAPPYAAPSVGPLGLRKKTLALLADWVLRLANTQCAVLLIEDLHWLDPSSLELIGLVLPRLADSALFVLMTHRPEFVLPWPESATLSALPLPRLPAHEARALVGASAAGVLSDARIDAIVLRSEGVPLFAEELARTLVGQHAEGDSSGAPAIPETLEASLVAHLEQAPDVKLLAQLASVLGREFPPSLLARLWQGDTQTFDVALSRAEQTNVLLRTAGDHEPQFSFRHALLRDAAYNSLLRRTRRRLHHAVAEILREHYPDVVAKQPELLAHHLTQAQETDAAIDTWLAAAVLAQGRAAYEEAIRHLRQAQALIATCPSHARALDVAELLGGVLGMARGWSHEETRSAWEAAAMLCDGEAEPLRAGVILCGLGDMSVSHDLAQSLAQFEQLIANGIRHGLPLLEIAGRQGAATALRYLGRYAEARAQLDAGVALYDPEKHHFVAAGFHEEKGISLLGWSAWVHWDLGALDAAVHDGMRAVAIAEQVGQPFSRAFACAWTAIVQSWMQHWPEAIALGQRAVAVASEHGFQVLEAMGRFAELSARGISQGMPEASVLFGQEIARLASTGTRLGGAEVLAVLANLLIEQGAISHAQDAVDMALGLGDTLDQHWCDAWLLTLKARCLPAPERDVEREALLTRALELARVQGAHSYALRAATVLARLMVDHGRLREAADVLAPALARFDPGLTGAELTVARQLMSLLP